MPRCLTAGHGSENIRCAQKRSHDHIALIFVKNAGYFFENE